jgi:hypothetical protein
VLVYLDKVLDEVMVMTHTPEEDQVVLTVFEQ